MRIDRSRSIGMLNVQTLAIAGGGDSYSANTSRFNATYFKAFFSLGFNI